jgi:hypothetical protein
VDCASCHTVAGFASAGFTVARHRETPYPLEGKHAAVPCSSCHTRDTTSAGVTRWGAARVVIRPAAGRCRDCHANDHGTQFATRADSGACSSCHTVKGWTPSSYGVDEHAGLRLPLTGRHAAVSCTACHGTTRPGLPPIPAGAANGKVKLLFRLKEVRCADCHQDVHRGRFASARDTMPAIGCQECHEAESFRPSTLTVERHRLTGFSLEGAHRATPCVACHKTIAKGRPASATLVREPPLASLNLDAPTGCAECHRSPHGDQFAQRTEGDRCESCHDAVAFTPAARFDHDRGTSFSLRGAHERVPCRRCHVLERNSDGTSRQRFRPLSGKCESCHAKGAPR